MTQQTVATHTPGPWTMEFGCVYRVGPREYGPDGDEMSRIALMDRDNHLTTPTERDANARLIAAAPALLEALVRILDNTGYANGKVEPTLGELAVSIVPLDAARHAIALATPEGKEPTP